MVPPELEETCLKIGKAITDNINYYFDTKRLTLVDFKCVSPEENKWEVTFLADVSPEIITIEGKISYDENN